MGLTVDTRFALSSNAETGRNEDNFRPRFLSTQKIPCYGSKNSLFRLRREFPPQAIKSVLKGAKMRREAGFCKIPC